MIDLLFGDISETEATLHIVLIDAEGHTLPDEWKDTPQGRMFGELVKRNLVTPGAVVPVAIDRNSTVLFAVTSFRRAARKEWFEAAIQDSANHAHLYGHSVAAILHPGEDDLLLSLEQIWDDPRVQSTLEVWSP